MRELKVKFEYEHGRLINDDNVCPYFFEAHRIKVGDYDCTVGCKYFEGWKVVSNVWEDCFVRCVADELLEPNKTYRMLLIERKGVV